MNSSAGLAPMVPLVGSQDALNVELIRNIRIAMSKGYRFIRLIHHQYGSIPERVYPVDGVRVRIWHNSMTKANESQVSQHEGLECMFIPDPDTGIRTAHILDTEFNRRFLASHLMEDRWDIEDPQVAEDVKKIASQMTVEVDTSKMRDNAGSQNVVTHEDFLKGLSKKQIAEELAKKRKELQDLEKIAEGKTGTVDPEEKAESGQLVSRKVQRQIPPDVLEAATMEIYRRNASTLSALKAQYGDEDFINSEEFKKTIQPQVDAEILRLMDEAQQVVMAEGQHADDKGNAGGVAV